MTKPPPPTNTIREAFGIAKGGYKRPLTPVGREVEQEAVQAWLERNKPTVCAPGYAIGISPTQTVGKGRGRYTGGTDSNG